MNNRIDITSTAVEKGIEIAKDFLDKLIMPSVEETGLLIKGHVTLWKFRNQVKMLNTAKRVCEENKISPKAISLKLLCPLLDYSALEEDENLQDKWAILLSNMVDSEQNIENHVFPYILSQISSSEFALLENVHDDKVQRQQNLDIELEQFRKEKPELIKNLHEKISTILDKIHSRKNEKDYTGSYDRIVWSLEREKDSLDQEIKALERKENIFKINMATQQNVPDDRLEEFEYSNLIRLGLIKFVQIPFANSQTIEIPYEHRAYHRGYTDYLTIDLNVDIESEENYILTELGDFFIKACKPKNRF